MVEILSENQHPGMQRSDSGERGGSRSPAQQRVVVPSGVFVYKDLNQALNTRQRGCLPGKAHLAFEGSVRLDLVWFLATGLR